MIYKECVQNELHTLFVYHVKSNIRLLYRVREGESLMDDRIFPKDRNTGLDRDTDREYSVRESHALKRTSGRGVHSG